MSGEQKEKKGLPKFGEAFKKFMVEHRGPVSLYLMDAQRTTLNVFKEKWQGVVSSDEKFQGRKQLGKVKELDRMLATKLKDPMLRYYLIAAGIQQSCLQTPTVFLKEQVMFGLGQPDSNVDCYIFKMADNDDKEMLARQYFIEQLNENVCRFTTKINLKGIYASQVSEKSEDAYDSCTCEYSVDLSLQDGEIVHSNPQYGVVDLKQENNSDQSGLQLLKNDSQLSITLSNFLNELGNKKKSLSQDKVRVAENIKMVLEIFSRMYGLNLQFSDGYLEQAIQADLDSLWPLQMALAIAPDWGSLQDEKAEIKTPAIMDSLKDFKISDVASAQKLLRSMCAAYPDSLKFMLLYDPASRQALFEDDAIKTTLFEDEKIRPVLFEDDNFRAEMFTFDLTRLLTILNEMRGNLICGTEGHNNYNMFDSKRRIANHQAKAQAIDAIKVVIKNQKKLVGVQDEKKKEDEEQKQPLKLITKEQCKEAYQAIADKFTEQHKTLSSHWGWKRLAAVLANIGIGFVGGIATLGGIFAIDAYRRSHKKGSVFFSTQSNTGAAADQLMQDLEQKRPKQ